MRSTSRILRNPRKRTFFAREPFVADPTSSRDQRKDYRAHTNANVCRARFKAINGPRKNVINLINLIRYYASTFVHNILYANTLRCVLRKNKTYVVRETDSARPPEHYNTNNTYEANSEQFFFFFVLIL